MNEPGLWIPNGGHAGRFPVQVAENGQLLARLPTGAGPPVAVISVPKAGTYLVARLLTELGMVDTELHVAIDHLTDYRGLSIAEKRSAESADRTSTVPIEMSARLVGPGQFLVGHVGHQAESVRAFAGFTKLLLIRDLLTAALSQMRFLIDSGRGPTDAPWRTMPPGSAQFASFLRRHGADLVSGSYRPLLPWLDAPESLTLTFEDLVGERGAEVQAQAVQRIAHAVDRDPKEAVDIFRSRVLDQLTPTLVQGRTSLAGYVDPTVHAAAAEVGLHQAAGEFRRRLAPPGEPPRLVQHG